ncbi:hypothetical protein BD309DRAFT_995132 [Dichomitus squalens]|uniref:Uncharacterized protein n=1 Tax=Dichomitus squalens TaxID=114155 RepID=A0A4Q9N9A5_9APHY|nr:hypothetical protein BD309DRAFT_995132 [Dichomitus squalens]TBU58896.1 hypothetical protein BD310DRAFT_958572 [Dichomitus squalens]
MANSAVPLESEEFLDTLLPFSAGSPPIRDIEANAFERLHTADQMRRGEVANLLVEAISTHRLLGSLTVSHYSSMESSLPSQTSDVNIAIFRNHDSSNHPPSSFDQLVPIEFGEDILGVDPFDSTEYEDRFGELEAGRKQLLDQITTTAEHLFAAQHRIALFMLLVIGRRFRLIRWDRAGTIVTPSVDYLQHPHVLCEVLWRLAHLDDSALGFDPSATQVVPGDIDYLRMDIAALRKPEDADPEERRLKDDEITTAVVFEYVRTAFRDSLKSGWPRYKLQVPDGEDTRDFLVGKPAFVTAGPLGRGTRGYVAYDCKTRRFAWLKDVWRASYIISDTEGDILATLNEANVVNVPTLVCHGDIRDQTTVTADRWERQCALSSSSRPASATSSFSSRTLSMSTCPRGKKRKLVDAAGEDASTAVASPRAANAAVRSGCPLRQHKHYRIAVEEVCMSLKCFKCGRQLVSLIRDCLRAHCEAATNPKTGGNILIYPKVRCRKAGKKRSLVWTGILSDWELSKPVEDQNTPSQMSQAGRMGTYQFMSVNLLSDLSRPVHISDELESFFHVLVYYSVRYLQSNCDEIESFIQGYFNNYAGPKRMYGCGQKSIVMEATGELRTQIPYGPLLFSSPMDNLIAFVLECFRSHYKILEYASRQRVMSRDSALSPVPYWPSTAPTSSVFPPGEAVDDVDDIDDIDDVDNVDVDDVDLIDWDAPPKDDSPTVEDEARAGKIMNHIFMLNIFSRALRQPLWTKDDRIPRYPPDATETDATSSEHRPSVPQSSIENASNKRQRTREPER